MRNKSLDGRQETGDGRQETEEMYYIPHHSLWSFPESMIKHKSKSRLWLHNYESRPNYRFSLRHAAGWVPRGILVRDGRWKQSVFWTAGQALRKQLSPRVGERDPAVFSHSPEQKIKRVQHMLSLHASYLPFEGCFPAKAFGYFWPTKVSEERAHKASVRYAKSKSST